MNDRTSKLLVNNKTVKVFEVIVHSINNYPKAQAESILDNINKTHKKA
jgi:hypothetical protein